MTEVISTSKFTTFDKRFFSAGHTEVQIIDRGNHRSFQKRYWAQLSCSRLIESGLPGADLAAEYVYGKYIRDLSMSIIQQSGRVILHFLHFLEREETNLYTLTRQDIIKFVEYEQGRGQKTQSVVNCLRNVYAFIKYLVGRDVLPETVMERKIRIKLPEALPRAITPEDQQRLLGAISSDRDRVLIAQFQTQMIPRSKPYEEELARDMSMMFLAEMSIRSLSMLLRLFGRSISAAEISSVNSQLT